MDIFQIADTDTKRFKTGDSDADTDFVQTSDSDTETIFLKITEMNAYADNRVRQALLVRLLKALKVIRT